MARVNDKNEKSSVEKQDVIKAVHRIVSDVFEVAPPFPAGDAIEDS